MTVVWSILIQVSITKNVFFPTFFFRSCDVMSGVTALRPTMNTTNQRRRREKNTAPRRAPGAPLRLAPT